MLIKVFFVYIACGIIFLPRPVIAMDRIIALPSPTPTREREVPTAPQERIITLPTSTSTPTPTTSLRRIENLRIVATPTTTNKRIQINPSETPTETPTGTERMLTTTNQPTETPAASFSAIISAAIPLGEITGSETATREGKPVYIFTAIEKLKLFGFIPLVSRVVFEVDQESHQLRKANRPWWNIFSVKKDWGTFFHTLGPNLTISDVTWDKKSYHAGDQSNISFNITNTGTENTYGSLDIVWRSGEKPVEYYKNFLTYLKPGETKNFHYFQPHSYECNQTIFIEIDETNKVKETDKKDNVWQGITQCAPTIGPDLAVSQLKLENPFFPMAEKRVGAKNTVKYAIQNIGVELSVKTRALMKTAGGQYLALIDVPPILPFLQITGEVHYTPNDCSPIELDIDTEKKNTEPDENNNFGTESPEITDHCKKGPDLSFGLHYYTSKDGYSFGKPHQDGESLLFQVEIINTATDETWGCARNVTLGVFENDKLYTTFNEGNFGFGPNCPKGGGISGTYDHPTTTKTQKFYYPAKCGATINLIIDPDVAISETDKSNNTWSQLIECQP